MPFQWIRCATLWLLLVPMTQATEIYKWVDANGRTHFGSQPPEGGATGATKLTVKAPPAGTDVDSAEAPSPPAGAPAEGESNADKRRNCEAAGRNLQSLVLDMRSDLERHIRRDPSMAAEGRQHMAELDKLLVKVRDPSNVPDCIRDYDDPKSHQMMQCFIDAQSYLDLMKCQ